MNDLSEPPKSSIDITQWEELERVGGVTLSSDLREHIENTLEQWTLSRRPDPKLGTRVNNQTMRRSLDKLLTLATKLHRLLLKLDSSDWSVSAVSHESLLRSSGPSYKGFCLSPDDLNDASGVVAYLADLGTALSNAEIPEGWSLQAKSDLKKTAKHAKRLHEALTSFSQNLRVNAVGNAVHVWNAKEDSAQEAAVLMVWNHFLRMALFKSYKLDEADALLADLVQAIILAGKHVQSGKRSDRVDWSRDAALIGCAVAYEAAGGQINHFYRPDDKPEPGSDECDGVLWASKFVLFLIRLDKIASSHGYVPLAKSDKAMAEAARKAFLRTTPPVRSSDRPKRRQ